MPDQNIIVYATNWCWDCKRAESFLQKHHISFTWIDIDQNQEAEQYVLKANQGMRSVPTMLFPDGSILVEPSVTQLAQKLGIENP